MYLVRTILQIGISDKLSAVDIRRVHLLNTLILISIVLSISLVVVDMAFGMWYHLVANAAAIFMIFIPSYWFNYTHQYKLARRYYVIMTSLLITLVASLSILNAKFTGTENMLVGFAVAAVILFNGKYKKSFFLLIFLEILLLEYLRFGWLGNMSVEELVLSMVYYTAALIIIFFFVDFFRKEFTQSYEKIVMLNKELAQQTEKVKETQAVYFDMIDNMPLFLSMMNSEGVYTAMNTRFAERLGFMVSDIIGKHYSEVLPRNILDKHVVKIEESLAGKAYDFSEKLCFPEGEPFHAYGSYMPLKNAAGEVVAVTHFVTDVSELKSKEEELEKLNESKNRLFSIIAHDLRKPLNLLNGFLFISQQDDTTEEEQKQNLELIDKQMKGLREMLDNLLLWARNHISGGPSIIRSHNLRELVYQEIRVYDPMIESKKIKLNNNIPESISLIIDDMFLRMVIRNVYTNAIKFTPVKGKIELNATEYDDEVILTIRDTGLGMPQEVVDQILSGEFVHSMEGTQGEKGSGIGLYLGVEMLKEIGGDIEICSAEGKGTEFSIKLSKHQPLSSVA